MTITFESGTTEEYEFVPIIAPMAVYKKTGKVSATIWLMVELRGYMTLYHNRTEATTRTISSKGNTMNPGHTDKYCRRPGEPGASMVLSTFSAGTNGFFKRLALVYFDDDQQIIDKIKSGKYTYKDLVEIIQEYNSCHGN